MSNTDSITEFFDRVAEEYGDVADSPIRQYCRLPAVQSLIPDVSGKQVLDAACGTGVDAAWLSDQGATVVGIDASEEMVQTADERFGDVAEFRQADLRESLDFLEDESFDVVSSQLTLSHLEEWDTVLGEFNRVLSDGGVLIASTDHPFRQFLLARDGEFSDLDLYPHLTEDTAVIPENKPPNYYDVEQYDIAVGPDKSHIVSFYRRPMSRYIQSFLDAGFRLEDVVEPMLTEEFKKDSPEAYERFLHNAPDFLCLKARKV